MPLFENIDNFKDNIALVSKSQGNINYRKIIENIKKISEIVSSRSIVFLITKNTTGGLISYISLLKNKSIVVLIDQKTPQNNLLNLIQIYKPDFLAGPTDIVKILNLDGFKYVESIYDYSFHTSSQKILKKTYKGLSLLLPTSGSMGSPKFVKLTADNLIQNAKSIISYLKINKKKRTVTTMPFSYSYMMSIINTYIETGASIYVTESSIIEKDFWEGFRKNKITCFSGVPYIFETLIKLGLEKIFTDSLEEFTQAGGKLNRESLNKLINFCKKKDIKFTTMYGQTEASPRISYLDWKYISTKKGSIGKAIPGTKIMLKDNDGLKIKESKKEGEIVFEGKNVCLGYANCINDLNKPDENKGVLHTGDIGYFDEDGFFYLSGRKNRIAKIFGNRINLDELEEKLMNEGYRVASKYDGNKISVFYEKNLSQNELLKKITLISGQNKNGFQLIRIDKLPITNSGKIEYSKLKK